MNVEFLGSPPSVKIPKKLIHMMRAVFVQSDKCSIFMKVAKGGSVYTVTDLYIPSQSSGVTYNIIDASELSKTTDFIGICHGGGQTTPLNIAKDEADTFAACFGNSKEYIRMKMNRAGETYCDLVYHGFVFKDIDVIEVDALTKDEMSAAKAVIDAKIRAWNYSDGYTQPKRLIYDTPEIIKNKIGWRDITGKKGFINLCKPNKDDLYNWLKDQMVEYYGKDNVVAQDGYMFCIGNSHIGLSAHIDTVFTQPPYEFVDVNGELSSPQGIGGDDRCGIYGVLHIMRNMEAEGKKPFVFLSTDEEKGGSTTKVGAKYCKDFAEPINFIIALDRQGKEDSVYYECNNKEFKRWIDSFGFIEAQGSRTDICTLCDEWDVAGVNFSVGYYQNHTEKERVVFGELENTLKKCMNIIHASDPKRKFNFQKKKAIGFYGRQYDSYGYGGLYDDFRPGDSVFVKKFGAKGYNEPRCSGGNAVDVPAYTELRIVEVRNSYAKVHYANKDVWISTYNLLLDYSA